MMSFQKLLDFKASGLLSSGRPAPMSRAIIPPNATEHINSGEYKLTSLSGTVSSINLGPTIDNTPQPTPYINLPVSIQVKLSTNDMDVPTNPSTEASMKVFLRPILRIMPPDMAPMVVPRIPLEPRSDW